MLNTVQNAIDEALVLECYLAQGEDYGFSFTAMADQIYLNQSVVMARDRIKAACHRLRDRGLLRFERALWTDDGDMCGAGYVLTKAGEIEVRRMFHG